MYHVQQCFLLIFCNQYFHLLPHSCYVVCVNSGVKIQTTANPFSVLVKKIHKKLTVKILQGVFLDVVIGAVCRFIGYLGDVFLQMTNWSLSAQWQIVYVSSVLLRAQMCCYEDVICQ